MVMSDKVDVEKYRRGLIMSVYRRGSDCTLGGVSSKHDEFLVVGPGIEGPFRVENSDRMGCPVLYLHRKYNIHGNSSLDYFFVSPDPDPLCGRYMFGGNFVYTSDSRKPISYPIPIHDRVE